jgi:hypothetical protein
MLKILVQNAPNQPKMQGKGAYSEPSKIPVAKIDGSLESAASFTRGGAPAAPDHDATERERTTRIEGDQPRLVRWTEICGKLGGSLPLEDTRGGEHQIHFEADRYLMVGAQRCFLVSRNHRDIQARIFNFLRRFFTPLRVRFSFFAASISGHEPSKLSSFAVQYGRREGSLNPSCRRRTPTEPIGC